MEEENVTISHEQLKQAYIDIIDGKKSLRMVAIETGIERKRLRRLIKKELTSQELEKFETVMSKRNLNGKDHQERSKKLKAINSPEYIQQKSELLLLGITQENLDMVYERCQQRPQTKISRDTLVIKMLELIQYFNTRNEGVESKSNSYISVEDIINMIMKNPRIINSDISKNIIPKCQLITIKKDSVSVANKAIKSNPGIFRKSLEDIRNGR